MFPSSPDGNEVKTCFRWVEGTSPCGGDERIPSVVMVMVVTVVVVVVMVTVVVVVVVGRVPYWLSLLLSSSTDFSEVFRASSPTDADLYFLLKMMNAISNDASTVPLTLVARIRANKCEMSSSFERDICQV